MITGTFTINGDFSPLKNTLLREDMKEFFGYDMSKRFIVYAALRDEERKYLAKGQPFYLIDEKALSNRTGLDSHSIGYFIRTISAPRHSSGGSSSGRLSLGRYLTTKELKIARLLAGDQKKKGWVSYAHLNELENDGRWKMIIGD